MNTENIKTIMQLFEDSKISKLELELDDMKIKMEKGGVPIATAPIAIAPSCETQVVEEAPKAIPAPGYWIKAPLVGTYYNSNGKGSTPFIEIGKQVHKGDTLCIIEAMKVMNEIHSPINGTVQEILITNESMVEFDQLMIRLGEDHD